jgi:nitrate reductase NapE component
LPSSSSQPQSQSTPDWLNNTAAPAASGGAFSIPSSESSSGGSSGQHSGFSVPTVDDLPPVEKKASDKTWVWILVGLLVMVPCFCIVGGFGFLTLLGGQVSEDFTEIESGLEDFDDDGFTGSDNSALGLSSNFRGTIEVGGRVDGELDTIFEADDWTFQGSAGQVVTISCNAAVGSGTDPRINLLGPDGDFIAADDDGGTNYNAILRNITLPADGEYTIKVDVFDTGRYVLRLE